MTARARACTDTHTHAHAHTHTRTRARARAHTHTQARTHARTHAHRFGSISRRFAAASGQTRAASQEPRTKHAPLHLHRRRLAGRLPHRSESPARSHRLCRFYRRFVTGGQSADRIEMRANQLQVFNCFSCTYLVLYRRFVTGGQSANRMAARRITRMPANPVSACEPLRIENSRCVQPACRQVRDCAPCARDVYYTSHFIERRCWR